MTRGAAADEPFSWWGPVWTSPRERSAAELIGDGVLDVEMAALLWSLVARRVSLAVIAGPSGAGKTTLLTALLAFLPPGMRRIYLRGCYEAFGFLDDPGVDPKGTVLLINELSAHLPTYLWGPAVRRALVAGRAGFGLLATAHATGAEEFVALLTGYPLGVPLDEVAQFQALAVLDAWPGVDGAPRREVSAVLGLQLTRQGGLAVVPLIQRAARGSAPALDVSAAAELFGRLDGVAVSTEQVIGELGARAQSLRSACGAAGTVPPSAPATTS